MRVSLIKPLDQPSGQLRLLPWLAEGLHNPNFERLTLIMAYAKSGPLRRLEPDFHQWRNRGGYTSAIFGVDQRGTSREALEFALALFDRVFVLGVPNSTFHPKMVWFQGNTEAQGFVGSNNLTVGGTETNCEAGVHMLMELPADNGHLAEFNAAWEQLEPLGLPLDLPLLERLVAEGYVLGERRMRRNAGGGDGSGWRGGLLVGHGFTPRPPSPLPMPVGIGGRRRRGRGPGQERVIVQGHDQGFALQIRPHHNGEIFLSTLAVRQDPGFFGWPFTGESTPRVLGTTPYPHRVPSPVVNIVVYGETGEVVFRVAEFQLTTVYYRTNSEIRVTSTGITEHAPELSIMVMELSDDEGVDYEISVYHPDCPQYLGWLDVCNQRMPGGGAAPRRFGWF